MASPSRRTFLRTISLASLATLVGASSTHAGKDPIERFRDTYADITSVSLTFNNSTASGTLKARRGSGYRIDMRDKAFVSDGKSIWTVSYDTKTIVIDRYDASNEQMSIERIFFVLLNVYRPKVESTTSSTTVIALTPPDASAIVSGVTKVECTLDKNHRIESIKVFEGGFTSSWKISNLKINKTVNAKEFTVTPSDDWTVVDLR